MLTLFTLEPLPKGGDRDRLLLDNFGYSKRDNNRSKELHSTLSCKRYNNQGLKLAIEKDKIRIKGKGKRLNIYWDIESVKKKFHDKLPALVYVLADIPLPYLFLLPAQLKNPGILGLIFAVTLIVYNIPPYYF